MSAAVPPPGEFLGVNLLAGIAVPADKRRALEIRLHGAHDSLYVLTSGDPWSPPERRAFGHTFLEYDDGWLIPRDAFATAAVREVHVADALKALGEQAAPPEAVPVQIVGATPAPANDDPFDGLDYVLWPIEKLEAEEKVEKARCDPNNFGNTSTDLIEIRAAIEKKRAAATTPAT